MSATAQDYVYTNDLRSAGDATVVGAGSFVSDATFGTVYQNVMDGAHLRSNYLLLPQDVLSYSTETKQMTIAFWVSAEGFTPDQYTYVPLFTAYAMSPAANAEAGHAGNADNWPIFYAQSRGPIALNNDGWCDFGSDLNVAGKNAMYNTNAFDYANFTAGGNWLEDQKWHYYTLVLTETNVKCYLDGEIKNEWNVDNTTAGQIMSGFFTYGGNYKHICLGGNQAFDWGDPDSPFKYAKLRIQNNAMTAEDIAAQMEKDKTTTIIGNEDNTTGFCGAFSDIYPIEAGKSLHLEFTNHHKESGFETWNNWCLALSNMAEGHSANPESPFYREGYSEYVFVRADNYGWGTYYNALGCSTNCDYSKMDGAKVEMDIIRRGPVVFIDAKITGSDNQEYFQKYTFDIQEPTATIYASLTVDGSHLIIDDTKTATTESTTEAAGDWIYTNDFSSAEGLTIVGEGALVADPVFGHAFKNVASTAPRTNYLLLPSDLLSHSVNSEALTVGFWVMQHGDYSWASPVFNAYADAPAEGKNGMPMFNATWRCTLQANVGRGWTDYTGNQNVAGENTEYYDGEKNWVGDGNWHYYTIVLEGENAKIYVDGTLKNEWNMDGTTNTQKGLFYTGSYLDYICLGGNQAWDWNDIDAGFSYAKFLATNKAMTAEDIAAQMTADKPADPEGLVGNLYNTTDRLGDTSQALTFEDGQMATFEFTNYSDKAETWHNWIACVNSGEAIDTENPLVLLRADYFEEVQASNTGITNNYNWDTFKDDMDASNVVLTIKYKNGRLIMRAKITTADEKEYFEEFVKGGVEGKVTACMSVFLSHLIVTKAEVTDLPAIPDNYVGYEDNTSIYLEETSEVLPLTDGKIATFEFTNYSDKFANWHNWIVCLGGETFNLANLAVALRADKWENIQASAEGIESDIDFANDDLNEASVVVTVKYSDGKAAINVAVTTKAGAERTITFTKEGLSGTITAAMSIDHAHLVMTKAEVTDDPASSISTIDAQNATQNAPMFDLSGRRVDASYKGIVIQNGKKMIVK